METNLKRLIPPGLQDIKQVKLYTQWGPLMPSDEEQNETYPKPLKEVIESVKADRKKRAQAKLLLGNKTPAMGTKKNDNNNKGH
eukprot:15086070-Ditylum_brightwellii.AAC.1